MFEVRSDQSIHLTRGDVAILEVNATGVFEKAKCDNVILEKSVNVEVESTVVEISLDSDDTRIGSVINKPKDYWYEIELNPDTRPQTIVGYDSSGPKIFRLYPEGGDD